MKVFQKRNLIRKQMHKKFKKKLEKFFQKTKKMMNYQMYLVKRKLFQKKMHKKVLRKLFPKKIMKIKLLN